MQNRFMRYQTDSIGGEPDEADSRYIVASLKRALEMMDVFLEPPHQYGVTDLSLITNQTKNQVYRFLKTLQAHNVVTMDEQTKKYRLGPRPMEWGIVAQLNTPIAEVAGPIMDELAEEVGETIVLTMLADQSTAICIDKRESDQVLQISAKVGRRVPLHAGAGGKCLLAFGEDKFRQNYFGRAENLEKFTEYTITDSDELLIELEQIRAVGYSISDEDLDPGACSVAAPVFDSRGAVIATISVASPKTRFGDVDFQQNSRAAVAAAKAASRRFGYHS